MSLFWLSRINRLQYEQYRHRHSAVCWHMCTVQSNKGRLWLADLSFGFSIWCLMNRHSFWLQLELKESQCLCVRPEQVCLKHWILRLVKDVSNPIDWFHALSLEPFFGQSLLPRAISFCVMNLDHMYRTHYNLELLPCNCWSEDSMFSMIHIW